MNRHKLPEPTEVEIAAAYTEDKCAVSNSLRAIHLPPINMDMRSSHIDLSFDSVAESQSVSFEKLIAL